MSTYFIIITYTQILHQQITPNAAMPLLSKHITRYVGQLIQKSKPTTYSCTAYVTQRRSCSSQSDPTHPVVHLPGLGKLRGSLTKGAWTGVPIKQFLNVRYAEPATGDRRFKAPVPAEPWEGVRDVSERGRAAPYYGDMKKMPKEELQGDLEDCISLCVYSKDVITLLNSCAVCQIIK